jgi:carboxymethylenebutenolidase
MNHLSLTPGSYAMKEIDPTNSTSPNVRRSMFLGATAAAAAGTATIGPAFAQSLLGKPHPPLVPEDDPSISVEHVRLESAVGAIPAYAALPRNVTATTPAIVVTMHIWGVDTSIRDFIRRLAKAGYSAIGPDLYGRMNAPTGDGATDFSVFRPFAQKLDRPQVASDLRAGAQWLKTRQARARVAVTGFCMGGAIALRQTIDNPDIFGAAGAWYGNPTGVDPAAVTMPVLGSYGGRDTSIPADTVHAFQKGLHVPNDIVIYDDAGHAFFDDQRSSYVADAAEDSWRRAMSFFAKYLTN